MAGGGIDREKLRVQLRRLSPEAQLRLLDQAIDLLSKNKLAALVEGVFSADELMPDGAKASDLLAATEAFDTASRKGEYYEGFRVDSRNFMDQSSGTQRWIAECERLLDQAVKRAAKQPGAEVARAFELLFGLLDRLDDGMDDIVFFADEGGAWQVGVDWKGVLPAFARCLSLSASPEAFAESVLGIVERHAAYDGKKLLPAIRQVTSPEHAAALDRLAKASKGLQ